MLFVSCALRRTPGCPLVFSPQAANAAIALVMAQVVDKKQTLPKPSSTISNDARMVLEALAPAAEAGAQLDDEVRTVMSQWSEQIAAEAARMRELGHAGD